MVGAPEGHPTLVSRHYTLKADEVSHNVVLNCTSALTGSSNTQRSCDFDFEGAWKGLKKLSLLKALDVNVEYGGWNVTTDRLIFVNGERAYASMLTFRLPAPN